MSITSTTLHVAVDLRRCSSLMLSFVLVGVSICSNLALIAITGSQGSAGVAIHSSFAGLFKIVLGLVCCDTFAL